MVLIVGIGYEGKMTPRATRSAEHTPLATGSGLQLETA
jgi:hypothetical protein